MNAIEQARQAYAGPLSPLRTPRQAEHQVLSAVTARLRAAIEAPGGDFPRLAAALRDNRRLWVRLAADVASPGNGLPAPLRARLFWLAEFTEHHSRRVLDGEAGAEVLVEINAAVLRGLSGLPAPAADLPQ